MQRLIVFLGHPTYSLSMVLFSLLVSSGIGSFLSERITGASEIRWTVLWFAVMIGTLVAFGAITPKFIRLMQTQPTTVRVLVAVGLLAPVGLVLGTAFPPGMNLAKISSDGLGPWFSTSFWIGCCAYIVAALSFLWASSKVKQKSSFS